MRHEIIKRLAVMNVYDLINCAGEKAIYCHLDELSPMPFCIQN